MPPERLRLYIVGVVGEAGSGRTTLITQFAGETIDYYDPTLVIEDSNPRKMIVVDNQKPIFVECSEFPTRPEYSALSDVLARTCSGYLLCFYLVNRESFEKLRTHRDFILKAKEKDSLPFVLVGCKSDLEQDRVIPRRECEELAREFDCPYFETSAKDDVNVTAPFEEIVREIRRYESLPEPAPKKKKKKMMMNECFDRCVVL